MKIMICRGCAAVLGFAPAAIAQDAASMTFFVTSTGMGDGANLGGLAGADAHCMKLAEAAGSTGKTGKPISVPRVSMPRTGSGPARGRILQGA
jgi:hypothetical protein